MAKGSVSKRLAEVREKLLETYLETLRRRETTMTETNGVEASVATNGTAPEKTCSPGMKVSKEGE